MDRAEIAPNFIMMVGLPGSGKTNTVRQLVANMADRDYVVLSPDDVVVAMGMPEGLNYTESVRKFGFKKAEIIFFDQLKQALGDRKYVIVDRTNLTVKIRAKLLRKGPSGYTKTAVICEVEPDVLQRRLEERADRAEKLIPNKVLTNMITAYQPPARPECDEFKMVRIVGK